MSLSDNEREALKYRHMLAGGWLPQMLSVVARLGIADLIGDGTRTVDELAAETSTHADSLYRVLRAVASQGIMKEVRRREFSLTRQGNQLRSDVPASVRHLTMWYGDEIIRSYAELMHSVKTGHTSFDQVYGKSIWEHLAGDPEAAEVFNVAMGTPSWRDQLPLPAGYDFSRFERLVDVGGGEGTMMAAILHQCPELKGVLLDLPAAFGKAAEHFEDAGVSDRVELVEGSAYEALPVGGDAYLLSSVIHLMDDDQAVTALGRVREAMKPDGRALILERVLPADNEPCFGTLVDVTMLAVTGGRERTQVEFADIYARAGFRLSDVVALPFFVAGIGLYIVEGRLGG